MIITIRTVTPTRGLTQTVNMWKMSARRQQLGELSATLFPKYRIVRQDHRRYAAQSTILELLSTSPVALQSNQPVASFIGCGIDKRRLIYDELLPVGQSPRQRSQQQVLPAKDPRTGNFQKAELTAKGEKISEASQAGLIYGNIISRSDKDVAIPKEDEKPKLKAARKKCEKERTEVTKLSYGNHVRYKKSAKMFHDTNRNLLLQLEV